MDLKHLEEQAAREEEKRAKRSVILTPKSDPIVVQHPARKPTEYELKRARENNFLRILKCPECQADVTLDIPPAYDKNLHWYNCTKNKLHTFMRWGALPSSVEDMKIIGGSNGSLT